MLPSITVIILTFNEELHIARCINSVSEIAERIFVVDSFSTDGTVEIAENLGATVVTNKWVNHATQMNWALSTLKIETDWVFRIDADEYLTLELRREIEDKIANVSTEIAGIRLQRRMKFLRRPIRYGGVFPVQVLRIFRRGRGRSESRWMDEHIVVNGATILFNGELIDDNLNTLTWWTQKHNEYASRETIDVLIRKHGIVGDFASEEVSDVRSGGGKRWIKERVYYNLPFGVRATFYFLYRYVLRLGFLDGREGAAFHALQGFWYRILVDAKIFEVEEFSRRNDVSIKEAVKRVLFSNVK
jgi:glycosyltransferase involved in cell wall biosynthesis